uniref:NAD(P)(+)--arginine ADP-ribosyltransferase n=1 Tax=Malurus cyaneus samueli TaxID=2593467 RepID=A0A8C5TSY3_9PASS
MTSPAGVIERAKHIQGVCKDRKKKFTSESSGYTASNTLFCLFFPSSKPLNNPEQNIEINGPSVCPVMAHTLMDMALHSFDDQYLGYREEMMEELEQGDCFQKEIAANKGYLSLWKKAWEALLKSSVDLLREMHDSHDIVLIAYTMNSSLHSQLNQATSTFKYFHFYLTTAIQIIKKWQSSMGEHKCYQVYRGVKDLRIEAMEGSMVQFGHFTSTSCLRNDARKFGNETWITVTTCLGAALQGFSYHTSEKEQGNWLHLHSVGNYSKYQCQLLEGGKLPMAFLKIRSGITFTTDRFSLRHSGKTHKYFGLLNTFIFSEKDSICRMWKAPWQ